MGKVSKLAAIVALVLGISGAAAGIAGAEEATKTASTQHDSWALPAKVEQKDGAEYCSLSVPAQKSSVKFAIINHHADCDEAEKVIQTLALYAKAYVSADYKTCGEYMTDGITTFDEGSKKLIVGKEAVLADMKARLDKAAPDSDSPLISYTIDNPIAHVKGDCCTISCIGIKVYGGKHPRTMESHSSYCFVKEGGKWKKDHFRTDWKQVDNPKS